MLIRGSAEVAEPLFGRVVVPVIDRDDAGAAATTLRSSVAMDATVIAVHVIEKADRTPHKASVEQRKQRTAESFSITMRRTKRECNRILSQKSKNHNKNYTCT